jgi:hypothetical protein
MTGLVDHPFQESAILKLLKLVACPSLRLRHSLQWEDGKGEGEKSGVLQSGVQGDILLLIGESPSCLPFLLPHIDRKKQA